MIELPTPPLLEPPTTRVKTSYLVGEQADMRHRGEDPTWIAAASRDFDGHVAERVGVHERWGVPAEIFWFISDVYYIGTLVIRHALTQDDAGGHIGYHVVYPWQRQGHATEMLWQGLEKASALGIKRALLTVEPDNLASITVVRRNGGVPDGTNPDGESRFWIATG